ncbi:serine hydrolase domain-containing protein [Phytohabitans sp. LJ34]|uniref:serine hydrolase domain-containing protein n=1 Tax=Phytohabitans sp. LJ34 TaxID=3452217 RepID=UPI003F89CA44
MIDERALAEVVDDFRARHRVPGVAVATFDPSGPLATVARGQRSVEEPSAPMRPDTLFRVYSVTKSLTATLIVQLAGEGVVDLDEPVVETLPRFRLRGDGGTARVTLRHLLSHQAGFIPDAVTHDGCGRDPGAIGEAAHAEPARTPLVGAPGQVYSYSNLGFTVAGHVAEVRGQRAFHDLFRERVAEPLGMTRTTHDPAVAMTYPLLQHHVDRDGALRLAHAPWVAAKHAPSSQCWSTVEDMARFGAMHIAGGRCATGSLVSPRLLEEAHRPHADVRLDIDLRYGLGFYIGPRDPAAARFGHEGFYDGMWCKLICVPAAGIGLVWADNRGDELRDPRYRAIDTILAALGAGAADWRRTTGWPDGAGPPDGVFERPASGAGLLLRTRGDRLLVTATDRELALEPVAADVWATPAAPDAAPPWRSHAGSRRVSLGAVRDPGGDVCHVLLNGLPYRRRARQTGTIRTAGRHSGAGLR